MSYGVAAVFAGELETHITVALTQPADLKDLGQWAHARGLKTLHIILERGATVSQPMLTRRGSGDLESEQRIAGEITKELLSGGYRILRVKIEASPENDDVPQTKFAAATQPDDRYFEHHIKFVHAADADLTLLRGIAELHSAHLSQNALRQRNDGFCERFITQRCMKMGRAEAARRLQELLHAIEPFKYTIIDVEEEFVVYDSNLSIDAGWIVAGE
jgi:hypothetical protein